MLMAVLMIVSLVPAVALAAGNDCDHVNKTEISIKKDTEAKQPGITAVVCKDCGEVLCCKIVEFAKPKYVCDICKNPVTVEVQKATCTEAGLTVTYCGTCGHDMDIAPKGVAALRHDLVFTVVEEPTCTVDGWGYAVCKTCGEPVVIENAGYAYAFALMNGADDEAALKVQAKFEATNYNHENEKALTAVTKDVVDEDGDIVAYAPVAATHVETIGGYTVARDKDGNLVDASVKGSTTKNDGTGYTGDKICAVCNEYVLEGKAVEALNTAHHDAMRTVEKGFKPYYDEANEEYVDGETDTVYCGICNKTFGGTVLTYAEFFAIQGENKVGDTEVRNDVAATCEDKGYTGDTYTWVMTKPATANDEAQYGWVLSKVGTEIPALGHHFVAEEGKDPTCTEGGYKYNGYYVCDRVVDEDGNTCGAHKGNDYEIPVAALGHKWVETVLVEATCYSKGLNVYVCDNCGVRGSVKYTVAVDHVAADELANVVEATCTEAGYTGDKVCKWCGEVLEEGKEAPALGHEYKDGVCVRCGAKDPNYVAPVVNPFTDVKEGDAFYEDIIWAADNKIVDGIKAADGTLTFQANVQLTRAQVVQMLWNANGKPEAKAAADFSDVAADAWYAKAVAWAVEAGIINGNGDGTFAPDAACTRAQFVKMLWVINGSPKADAADFSDVAADAWYAQAVAWAAANEVTLGDGAGKFLPNDTCTRGQAVAFLHRAPALTVSAAE